MRSLHCFPSRPKNALSIRWKTMQIIYVMLVLMTTTTVYLNVVHAFVLWRSFFGLLLRMWMPYLCSFFWRSPVLSSSSHNSWICNECPKATVSARNSHCKEWMFCKNFNVCIKWGLNASSRLAECNMQFIAVRQCMFLSRHVVDIGRLCSHDIV